eukprot:TRINITY_DN33783_c0_g1_i1.p1 TRINITY_DN33783_c0_g1~~TRINITY_DN33783_c0_g1_i1.p1  ORF type:complete len:298 (-),score=130.10 TRINITY_DN33783_c0_g1_i1:385-1278(-)
MGPPKDRLAAMQANAYFEDDDSFNIPIDEEAEGPMKEFFKEVEEIREVADKIDAKINEVKKLQTQILNSPKVDAIQQAQMDDLMAEIKKMANTCRSRLKKMEQETEAEEKGRGNVTAEIRIRKTQHMTASRRFVEVMTEYNRIQVSYREESKEQIKRQMEISGKTATDEELEQMLEGGGARLTGHIHIEGNEEQLRQTINDIEARHEMFIKLEQSIKELHEMFMDIAMLVENQGEMVNRIDAHVESAVEYTTRATNDTKKALEYQSKARRKKIMILLCMIIGGSLGTYMGLRYLGFV